MAKMNQQTGNQGFNAVILVAAGRGTRMGQLLDGPKQYQLIHGISVLQHAINAFVDVPDIDHVQVVIHADDMNLYQAAVLDHPKLLPPVIGGSTRQQSAQAGLKALMQLDIGKILIHDAARPFVDSRLIERCLSAIAPGTCIVPAIKVAETVKRAKMDPQGLLVEETVPRDNLYLAQTPQGFVYSEILAAHTNAHQQRRHDFTDDAAVGEHYGQTVRLVEGNRNNRKITTFEDLEQANMIRNSFHEAAVPDIRTGNGYDVHRLIDGDGIVLCGIHIKHDKKLDGHSDADVGLHAITDALLGTIADGDIGSHFPPSDPRWKGASSDRFLAHACMLVRAKGGVITHLDITLICEEPKIGPHRDFMRAKIAEICDVNPDQVAVKATTNERIGFIGRNEGIAAIATATVVVR